MSINTQTRKSILTHSALNSVSASELLKALQTLQNINVVQNYSQESNPMKKIDNIELVRRMENINIVQNPNDIEQDLNISFSQKQNFNALQIINQQQNIYHAQNNHQENQNTHLSKQNIKKSTDNNQNQKGKMNFEFYMCKKQIKNNSKSPRISTNKNNTFKKTFQKNQQNKTFIKNQIKNKSLSPLTQRSINLNCNDKSKNKYADKKQRLKTQAFQKQNQSQTLCHKKQNSSFATLQNYKTSNKQNLKTKNINQTQSNSQLNANLKLKPKKSQNIPRSQQPQQVKQPTKTRCQTTSFSNLSVHERTKQYIKQKNQRLQKLAKQIQQKRKQQQKQCTFKPKIINTNVKSKYNDLCNSYELQEKHKKRCKINRDEEQDGERGQYNKTLDSKIFKSGNSNGHSFKKKLNEYIHSEQANINLSETNKTTKNNINYQKILLKCSSAQLQQHLNSRISTQTTKQKPKYKNAKFNTLLDMIH